MVASNKRGCAVLAKNAEFEMTIEAFTSLGSGMGHWEGQVVFVPGAVPGDRVLCHVIRAEKNYAIAKIRELLAPSPDREPDCCAAHGCGGCVYGAVRYDVECAAKREGVVSAFRRAGLADIEVAPVVTAGERLHYRNKAQYPVAPGPDGRPVIGFYAPRSHRVIPAQNCPLQPVEYAEMLTWIGGFIEKYHISPYDEAKKTGFLRHICLRRGTATGEVLLVLVGTCGTFPHAGEFADGFTSAFPQTVGILLNVNAKDTNVIFGDTFLPLWGRDDLVDVLAGVRLRIAAGAFYQVNHAAAGLLYEKAAELACLKGDELLLDLFCGAGSIGLSMAGRVREVIGVEIQPEAVACAKRNAAENGIRNASFYCADASDTRRLLTEAERARGAAIRPDVVVLDPPRKGCSETLLQFLAELAPSRIVYISCNPDTLATNVATLKKRGYTPGVVTPFDLFPRTGHVESGVWRTRRLDVDMRR